MKAPGILVWSSKNAQFAILVCLLLTIPLLYGAVHPIVTAMYGSMLLVFSGCWLVMQQDTPQSFRFSMWYAAPLIIISYQLLQVLPLPLEILQLLTPVRAGRVQAVNTYAGAEITAAALSECRENGLRHALFLLGVFLYYICLTSLLRKNKKYVLTLCYCLVAVGLFEAFYGLLQFVRPESGVLWLDVKTRAAHGSIIYKNQYASLMNMIWPLALGCGGLYFSKRRKRRSKRLRFTFTRYATVLFPKRKSKTLLLQGAAMMMVLAVLFSLSRGGILAMLLVIGLLVSLLPFRRRRKMIFFGIFFGLIFCYGAMLGFSVVIERFSSLGEAQGTRTELYMSSLPMLWDHWLTGTGVNGYALLSPIYLKSFPAELLYDRAHSEYLEILIELGLPTGLLFLVWLVGGMTVLGKRLLQVRKDREQKDFVIIGISAYCAMIGFFAHGLVDFGWRLPANIVYCATLLAITVVCFGPEQQNRVAVAVDEEDMSTDMLIEPVR